jgi:hypothetical protein
VEVRDEAEAWVDHMGKRTGTHMPHMGGEDGRGYDGRQPHERLQLRTGSDESRGDGDDGDVMLDELQEAL